MSHTTHWLILTALFAVILSPTAALAQNLSSQSFIGPGIASFSLPDIFCASPSGFNSFMFNHPTFDSMQEMQSNASYITDMDISTPFEKPLSDKPFSVISPIPSAEPSNTITEHVAPTKLPATTDDGSKSGLTAAEQKMDTGLLQLLGVYSIPGDGSREDLISTMIGARQYKPAGSESKDGRSNDEMVYVYVYLDAQAATDIIDPYAWNVTDRDEQGHVAAAWVEVGRLQALASLDGVKSIQLVEPPVTR